MKRRIDLFDGTLESFDRWRQVGPGRVVLAPSEGGIEGRMMVASAEQEFGVLVYDRAVFGDFTLNLEFALNDPQTDNSGVFVRFREPERPLPPGVLDADQRRAVARNRAWIAAFTGFEIQIDELARGNPEKGEPDGLDKHRTGAVYGVPAGQNGEPRLQDYRRPAPLLARAWNTLSVEVAGHRYRAWINGSVTAEFSNRDLGRGIPPCGGADYGRVGLQCYRDSRVAFRKIRAELS